MLTLHAQSFYWTLKNKSWYEKFNKLDFLFRFQFQSWNGVSWLRFYFFHPLAIWNKIEFIFSVLFNVFAFYCYNSNAWKMILFCRQLPFVLCLPFLLKVSYPNRFFPSSSFHFMYLSYSHSKWNSCKLVQAFEIKSTISIVQEFCLFFLKIK